MRRIPQNRIQPKVSTMPRPRSEAAAFLDIYKLVIEKKRLQQELENMEQRRQQISSRLTALDAQVADLEQTAHQIRSQTDPIRPDPVRPNLVPSEPAICFTEPSSQNSGSFETFFLDY